MSSADENLSASSSRSSTLKDRRPEPDIETDNEKPQPSKRRRLQLACTRCRTRKQKCDGGKPECSTCKPFNTACEYVTPGKMRPYDKYEYVKDLEWKVAKLEALLTRECLALSDAGQDQLRTLRMSDPLVESAKGLRVPNFKNPEYMPHATGTGKRRTPSADSESPFSAPSYRGAFGMTAKQTAGPSQINKAPGDAQGRPKSMPRGEGENIEYPVEFLRMSTTVAERLFKSYFKNIATRWPILHSPQIRDMHAKRLQLTDPFEVSSMSLVYAIGGRFLETTGESGDFFPERHYNAALEILDKLQQPHDMRAVQTLLLHAVYCLRAPRRPGAWTYIGFATRMCIELGYHRSTPPTFRPKLLAEMWRRLFWTCYCLDRQVSVILGRPFAIADRDIDAELPWDIDESATEEDLDSYAPATQDYKISTTMSLFIHLTKLRRIESGVQQVAYRVDKPTTLPAAVIDRFLEELEEWKERIPLDNRFENQDVDQEMTTFDGSNYYMTYYHEIIRNLLYPQLSDCDTRILVKCAEACGGVCKTYQQLLRQATVGFSLMALYSVFLAGLTLVYCIWQDPVAVFSISVNNDLNACSIVLYVISERWPGARKYRNAFETIKQCIMDFLGDGEPQPRKPLTSLDANLRATLKDVQSLHSEGKQDFGRMVGDMLGTSTTANTTPVAFTPDESLTRKLESTPIGYSPISQRSSNAVLQPGYGVDIVEYPDSNRFLDSSLQIQMQMQVPTAMELLGGFDMEDFMATPTPFWESMVVP